MALGTLWMSCEGIWRGCGDIVIGANDMNKARAFNQYLCAATDRMKELVAEVQTQVEGYEAYYGNRKRARRATDQITFERTIEAIICDLCAVEIDQYNDSIHLPLSNKTLRSKSRYKGTALGKTLPDIIKVMEAPEMAFVIVEKGHSKFQIIDDDLNVQMVGGQQTVLRAGPKLLSRIERFAINRADLRYAADEEVLILRAPKRHAGSAAQNQEYEDDEMTITLRSQIANINAWLGDADITCGQTQRNSRDRRLRRIFNNSDFGQGGRLYGGFWQGMSSDERQEHIQIDDDCCVELDYGQMSIALLYGLTSTTPPEGDLYDLSAEGIPTQYRKGVKTVIQALINSNKVPTRMPKGVRDHLPTAYSIRDVLSAVSKKHSTIYPKMIAGIGMQLFRKESDILVEVLLALKAEGIVALPIHDAVVVSDDKHQEATEIMKRVFKDHTGITPEVSLG